MPVGRILAGVVAAMVIAWPAVSHPLGNFAIDHYSHLRVDGRVLEVRYIIDMAEIPTFEELRSVDANGDGRLSPAEKRAYLDRRVGELAAGLTATLNGRALRWEIESGNLTGAPSKGPAPNAAPLANASGLPTVRILVSLRAELPRDEPGPYTVAYEDRNFRERTGWKEIVLETGEGIRVRSSSAPRADVSNQLTSFPADVAAPPQDVSARFTYDVAVATGPDARFAAVLRKRAYAGLMLGVVAVALLLRWRASRKADSGAGPPGGGTSSQAA